MRVRRGLGVLILLGGLARAALPDGFEGAEGFFEIAAAEPGATRLQIEVPEGFAGKSWVLTDTGWAVWPMGHVKAGAREFLRIDAPARVPLRVVFGSFPEAVRRETRVVEGWVPTAEVNRVAVALGEPRSLEAVRRVKGLAHPLRLLTLWFVVAVFSFVGLGSWYRRAIRG